MSISIQSPYQIPNEIYMNAKFQKIQSKEKHTNKMLAM